MAYHTLQCTQQAPSNLQYKTQQIQQLNVSRPILQLSVTHPLKPGVKSIMKMQFEQRQQAILRANLSGQQFIAYKGLAYIRGLKVYRIPFSCSLLNRQSDGTVCVYIHCDSYNS